MRRKGRKPGHARPKSFLADGESLNAINSNPKSRKLRAQRLAPWLCFLGCIAGLVSVAGVGLVRTHAQESFPLPAINPPGAKAANAAPAPAAQPAEQQAGATANGTGKPEVARQCAELLKLATDLKAAVDKTSATTLSVTVVRKAGEIEQLAHRVRNLNAKN